MGALDFLGSGLFRPFVRDQKNDFANGAGVELVKARVGQILGTRAADDSGDHQGELEWRPAFGSKLYLLQHRKGALLTELAWHYVVDALKWEPCVTNVSVEVSFDPSQRLLTIDLTYDIISANVPGNAVVVSGVQQTVNVPLLGGT